VSSGMLALRECLRVCPPELAGSCMRLSAMAVPDGWPPARFGGSQNPAYKLPRPPPDLRERAAVACASRRLLAVLEPSGCSGLEAYREAFVWS
jgi:hypothetical protein